MLLCLPLGDMLAGALSLAQARELSKRARAIGIGEDDPLREVTQKDVQRLGYSEAEAAHIVALLNRERQLDGYLLAAEKAGVAALNLNDLACALRPTVQMGDLLDVRIVKAGREATQGVGYTPDGTMVVVEGGRDAVGQVLHVQVSSVLQTSAGRMIFAKKV